MKIHEEISYTAPPAAVLAMLTNPAFREKVCRRTHALDSSIKVDGESDTIDVVVWRLMPAEVPAIVRSLVGDHLEIEQVEHWTVDGDPHQAELSLCIVGRPVKMTGSTRLEPADDGTRQVIDGDLAVKVPFIGGKIEPEIAKAIRAAIGVEAEVGREYLERARQTDGS